MATQTLHAPRTAGTKYKSVRSNPLVYLRPRIAKRLMAKIRRRVKRVLDHWNREAALRVSRGEPVLPADWSTRWTKELIEAQRKQLYFIASVGIQQAQMELQAQKGLADEDLAIEVGTVPTDFVLEPVKVDVDEWLVQVSSPTTKRHAAEINKIHRRAQAIEGITPFEQAKEILTLNSTYNFNRARMIAYTNTNWAMNAGARQQYKSIGITTLEWLTTKDDRVCPFCASMDGAKVGIADPFWPGGSTMGVVIDKRTGKVVPGLSSPQNENQVLRTMNFPFGVQHPPLHPYCACTVIPVIERVTIQIQEAS